MARTTREGLTRVWFELGMSRNEKKTPQSINFGFLFDDVSTRDYNAHRVF